MGNFSRQPSDELRAAQDKGYVELHVEQGVPVLDRDLNLMADLISSTLRRLVQRYVGDGLAPGESGFRVQPTEPPSNNIMIGAGSILAGGFELTNPITLSYTGQAGLTPDETNLSAPSSGTRTDCVYIDAYLQEITSNGDGSLGNDTDVGMQTSIRLRPAWIVRVAKGLNHVPSAPVDHVYAEIAWLVQSEQSGSVITEAAIVDRRPARMKVAEAVRRLDAAESALAPRFDADAAPSYIVSPGSVVLLSGVNFEIGVDIAHNPAVTTGEDPTLAWVVFMWVDAFGNTQYRAVPNANVRHRSDHRPGLEVLVPSDFEGPIPRSTLMQTRVRTLFGHTESDKKFGLSKVLAFAKDPFYWNGASATGIPAGETLFIHLTPESNSGSYTVTIFGINNQSQVVSAFPSSDGTPNVIALSVPLSATFAPCLATVQVANDEGGSITEKLTIELPIPKFDIDNPFEPYYETTVVPGGYANSMYPEGQVALWLTSGSMDDDYTVRLVPPEGQPALPAPLTVNGKSSTQAGRLKLIVAIPSVAERELEPGSEWRFEVTNSAGYVAISTKLFEVEQELPAFSVPPLSPGSAPPGMTVYVSLRRLYNASYSVVLVITNGVLKFEPIRLILDENRIAAPVPATTLRGNQTIRVSNEYQRYIEADFKIESP